MAPIAGKKVLVIGGSSGLGFGVAKAALAEGAHVVIASSNATKSEAAAQRLGTSDFLQWHVLDASKEESFEALFAKTGKVDHLVYTVCFGLHPLKSVH
jgi:NAD(P)-dependent dehydrogenase (short-subunit alcohol dehydrogenase family)